MNVPHFSKSVNFLYFFLIVFCFTFCDNPQSAEEIEREKMEMRADIEAQKAKIEERMDQIEDKADNAEDLSEDYLENVKDQMELERDKLDKQLEKIENTSNENWSQAKSEIESAINEAQKKADELLKDF